MCVQPDGRDVETTTTAVIPATEWSRITLCSASPSVRERPTLLMSLRQLAQEHGLHRVGARPPLGHYLAEVWQRRDFIFTMANYRLRAELEVNRLGIAWVVLRPILSAAIYGTIFGLIQMGNRPPDFAAFVVVGVFFFDFFQSSFNDGAKAITNSRSLLQSLAFPRMTLPLAVAIEKLIAFVVMLIVLVPILALLGHYPTWDWLFVIPLVALFVLFNAGIAMYAARLTVHVADLTQLIPFITRILFYTSGVLFAVDRILADHPWALRLFDFHPIYQVVHMARHYLIGGSDFPLYYWALFSAISVVIFVSGALFFWSAEERYGRD